MDHYLYLDETGSVDFDSDNGSAYFAISTAHFASDHRDALWAGLALRLELEAAGVALPQGFHASDDSHHTRAQVCDLILEQSPMLDVTALAKNQAKPQVRDGGKPRLYKMAVWLHLKHVVPKISRPGDRVFLIVAHVQTTRRRLALRNAINDVSVQLGADRTVIPCIWEARTSWGIQVADYAGWVAHRDLAHRSMPSYAIRLKERLASTFLPWGSA